MNRIDDPRLLFYLKHQALIEEWATVKDDVRHAAIDFYESLAVDLEAEAESLDGDVVVIRRDAGDGYVGLANRVWLDEGDARVGVVLEWQRSSASFTSGKRLVGVRVALDAPGGQELRTQIGDRVRTKREGTGFPNRSSWWPAYADASGAEGAEYWKDLEQFRQDLIKQIRSAWVTFAADIDEAMRPTLPTHDISI